MSYKTVLVHADLSSQSAKRIRLAAHIASTQRSHLVGAAMCGFPVEYYRTAAMMFAGPLPQSEFDRLRMEAEQALTRFETMASAADVQSFERRLCDDDTLSGMVLQARYADLVVLSQCDPGDCTGGELDALPEHVALYGGRPVLVLPYAGKFERIDRHALVAWDGSRAAIRAVTDAVPLLRRSGKVTLVIFNPDAQPGVHGEQPGADMALYLARHGVNVEVLVQKTPDGLDVGNALLSLAYDLNVDLIVMGAYGHLRWRELVLGGVTRTIIRTMTVPVLMAH